MGVDFELDSLGLRLGRFDSILATLASLVISYGLKGTDLESLTTMVGLPDLGAFFDLSELIFLLVNHFWTRICSDLTACLC